MRDVGGESRVANRNNIIIILYEPGMCSGMSLVGFLIADLWSATLSVPLTLSSSRSGFLRNLCDDFNDMILQSKIYFSLIVKLLLTVSQ